MRGVCGSEAAEAPSFTHKKRVLGAAGGIREVSCLNVKAYLDNYNDSDT